MLLRVLVWFLAMTNAMGCVPAGTPSWQGGDIVAPGTSFVIDRDYQSTRGIVVRGQLFVADSAIRVSVPFIDVVDEGRFVAGTAECPLSAGFTLELVEGAVDPQRKAFRVMDRASVSMRGVRGTRGDSWARLGRTALAGDSVLTLDRPVPTWRRGDEVVVPSTDFSPAQTEVVVVREVRGSEVALERPLAFMHYGEVTFGVDERGEAALLTRDITVTGSQDFGMHTMFATSRVDAIDVTGVRFRYGGQPSIGRYPVHFHMMGGAGGRVRACMVDASFFRGVTIHGSQRVVVEDTAIYDVQGHGFFFEDGSEFDVSLNRNLGIGVKPVSRPGARLGSDVAEHVSVFWMENPNVTLVDNLAVASDATGYWYHTRLGVQGLSAQSGLYRNVRPASTPIALFARNSAHGVTHCLFITPAATNQNNVPPQLAPSPEANWGPRNADGSRAMTPVFGLTCHHARQSGVWIRLDLFALANSAFADMPEAVQFGTNGQHPGRASWVLNSVFVGRSGNRGTMADDAFQAFGAQGSCARGFGGSASTIRIYDGPMLISNVTFRNVLASDCKLRGVLSGSMDTRLYNIFQMAAGNAISGARFENVPVRAAWQDVGADGGLHTTLFDADGSTTGFAGATVVHGSLPFFATPACRRFDEGNTVACPNDFANLQVMAPGSTRLRLTRLTRLPGEAAAANLDLSTPQAPTFLAAASPGAAYLITPSAQAGEVRVQAVSMAQGARLRFAICVPGGATVRVQYGTSADFVPSAGVGMQDSVRVPDLASAWARNDAFFWEGGVLAFSVAQTAATAPRPGRPGCPAVGGCNRVHLTLGGWAPRGDCISIADTADDRRWASASLVPAAATGVPNPPAVVNPSPVVVNPPAPPPMSTVGVCRIDLRTKYVGCFRDLTTPVRMLPMWLGLAGSARECVDRAIAARMKFAGLQWNAECWAGNGPLPSVEAPIENCMFECTGRGGVGARTTCVDCGTGGFNAVYLLA
jgi:cell migration-inducing and hyaluronan-binding protein